jgi:hypothetical protein
MTIRIVSGIVVLSCVILALFVPAQAAIDYQQVANGAEWSWGSESANPLGCLAQCGDKYDISLLSQSKDRYELTITVLLKDKVVYQWKGHRHSVFRIVRDKLYYAKFHPSSNGGAVVAVDLGTGKTMWESPLKGIGVVPHSAYSNLMTLTADDEIVAVYGNESMGRYFEVKSVATGKTVGHRLFPKKNRPSKAP